ncbi:MAG: 2OG-Fe(II) oxygenase [Candidatus Binatia bacterium]
MPTADFFGRLGLFVLRDFFDAELCARLRSETCLAAGGQAMITRKGTDLIDESVRRTKWVEVPPSTNVFVESRLSALKPMLERHFCVVLKGCERPQFLIYKGGDFFLPHQDSQTDPDVSPCVRERRVSVAIFLNGEARKPKQDNYGGGSLTFYGLIDDDPRWKPCGFGLIGEAGMVIAFRSDVLHEVTPVTHGERYTIVTWFS